MRYWLMFLLCECYDTSDVKHRWERTMLMSAIVWLALHPSYRLECAYRLSDIR